MEYRQNTFAFWSSVVVSNHSSDRTILRRLYLTRRSDNKHDPSRWVGNTATSCRKINRVTLQLQCSIWVTDERTHLPSGPQWYKDYLTRRSNNELDQYPTRLVGNGAKTCNKQQVSNIESIELQCHLVASRVCRTCRNWVAEARAVLPDRAR